MPIETCAICASSLRNEIEKRDMPGKVDGVIQWAKSNGVPISRFSLAKHRANHIKQEDCKTKAEKTIRPVEPKSTGGIGSSDAKKTLVGRQERIPEDAKMQVNRQERVPDDAINANKKIIQPLVISDQLLLDTVRDMVYKKLVDGEIELKIDSAFKAIEIKQKISEGSQNEKLLLEILSEIRKEELARENMTNSISKPVANSQ